MVRGKAKGIGMALMQDKVAVITGGASGIGLAMARRFGADGAKIVLGDIEQVALDGAVAALRDAGIDAIGVVADVAKYDQVEALAAAALDRFGKVHIVCNNAGVSITGPSWAMSLDDWRWVYDVNVWGVVHGIRAFVPILMRQGEGGHIVNTASLAAFSGNGDHAPYCSSKFAVLGMSQSLHSEMAALQTDIGVHVVCSGMVATRIHQSWRNRPEGDTPWSDREFANPAFVKGSEAFQGNGISPDEIAQSTFEAIRDNRFYVFSGTTWPLFLEDSLGRAIRAENPRVITWGEDRRPAEARETPPWRAA